MQDLVIFALPAKRPKDVLSKINFPNKLIAPVGKKPLNDFAIKLQNYKFIIGMGGYYGRDQENLRLETSCHNEKQSLEINNLLNPIEGVIPSKDIGSSYCNYISFLIMEHIINNKLDTSYSFIHIPKKMNSNLVSNKINRMIENFLNDKLYI